MSTRSSKPSTSILMKAGRPWSWMRRSRVRHGTVIGVVPDLALPPRRSVGGADEIRRSGRDRRVGGVDVERQRALRRAGGGLQQDHRGVAAVDQPDRPRRPGLRLEGDDTGAEAAEGGDAVADMGADVEGEIAGLEEAAHRARPWRGRGRGSPIVDLERARGPPRPSRERAPSLRPARGADFGRRLELLRDARTARGA